MYTSGYPIHQKYVHTTYRTGIPVTPPPPQLNLTIPPNAPIVADSAPRRKLHAHRRVPGKIDATAQVAGIRVRVPDQRLGRQQTPGQDAQGTAGHGAMVQLLHVAKVRLQAAAFNTPRHGDDVVIPGKPGDGIIFQMIIMRKTV